MNNYHPKYPFGCRGSRRCWLCNRATICRRCCSFYSRFHVRSRWEKFPSSVDLKLVRICAYFARHGDVVVLQDWDSMQVSRATWMLFTIPLRAGDSLKKYPLPSYSANAVRLSGTLTAASSITAPSAVMYYPGCP